MGWVVNGGWVSCLRKADLQEIGLHFLLAFHGILAVARHSA